MNDLVSIIVPVYNAEKYIQTCADSLIKQSYPNIEIIFVNDGSTDNTLELLTAYDAHKNVHIISKPNNGVSAARNNGLSKATGEYIFFIDADDFLETEAIEKLVKAQKESNADLVVSGFKNFGHNIPEIQTLIFDQNKTLNRSDINNYVEDYLKQPNRHHLFVYSWGRLFRADTLKENKITFNEGYVTYEDVWFNFDVMHHIETIYYVSEPLLNFRRHPLANSALTKIEGDPDCFFGFLNALESAKSYLQRQKIDHKRIEELLAKAVVTYTIIQLIRLCGNLEKSNFFKFRKFISGLIRKPWLQNSLPYYVHYPGASQLIPKLMRLKLTSPLMLLAAYKAYKRYG